MTPRVLSEDECEGLAGMFGEEDGFRTTVDMRRLWFGSGVYRYFHYPLPGAVWELRESFYPLFSRVAKPSYREHGPATRGKG